MVSSLFITLLIIPIYYYFKYFNFILAFWLSIFLAIFVYASLDKDEIIAKEFLIFVLVVPISILYIISTNALEMDTPLKIVFIITSIFFTLNRVINNYIKYRDKLFNGDEPLFLVNSFTPEDCDKLFKELCIIKTEDIAYINNTTSAGIAAVRKTYPDIEIGKACFEESLKRDPNDNMTFCLLAIMQLNSDNQNDILDAYNSLISLKEKQKDMSFNGARIFDIDECIEIAKSKLEKTSNS